MNFSQSEDWGECGFKRPVPDDPKCVVHQPFPTLVGTFWQIWRPVWISEGLKLHFEVLFSGIHKKILEIRWPKCTLSRCKVSPDLVWVFLGNISISICPKSKTITFLLGLLAFERAIARRIQCRFANSCPKRCLHYFFRTELSLIVGSFWMCVTDYSAVRSHRWSLTSLQKHIDVAACLLPVQMANSVLKVYRRPSSQAIDAAIRQQNTYYDRTFWQWCPN